MATYNNGVIIRLNKPGTIRYTVNNWLTYVDISRNSGNIKINLNKTCIFEYAINYGNYWDNNNGKNYIINYKIKKSLHNKINHNRIVFEKNNKFNPPKKTIIYNNGWDSFYSH